MKNRVARTGLSRESVSKMFPEGDVEKIYQGILYIMKKYKCSVQESTDIYKMRVNYKTKSKPLIYKGKWVILEYLCDIFNRDLRYTKYLLAHGYDLILILETFVIHTVVDPFSLELNGIWYPFKLK